MNNQCLALGKVAVLLQSIVFHAEAVGRPPFAVRDYYYQAFVGNAADNPLKELELLVLDRNDDSHPLLNRLNCLLLYLIDGYRLFERPVGSPSRIELQDFLYVIYLY
ncbi:hypothetical protein ES708_33865 [subsurface metagenome]